MNEGANSVLLSQTVVLRELMKTLLKTGVISMPDMRETMRAALAHLDDADSMQAYVLTEELEKYLTAMP